MRIGSGLFVLASLSLAISGCDNPPPVNPDAGGTDDAGGVETCADMIGSLSFAHDTIGVVPGSSRHTYIEAAADAPADLVVNLTASTPGILPTTTIAKMLNGRRVAHTSATPSSRTC